MIRCKWFIAVEQVTGWVTDSRQVVNPLWLQRKMPYLKPACAHTPIAHQTEGGLGVNSSLPNWQAATLKIIFTITSMVLGCFWFLLFFCTSLSIHLNWLLKDKSSVLWGQTFPCHTEDEKIILFSNTRNPALTSLSKLWFCNLYLHLFFLLCSLYGCYWKQGQWSTFSIISKVKYGSPI